VIVAVVAVSCEPDTQEAVGAMLSRAIDCGLVRCAVDTFPALSTDTAHPYTVAPVCIPDIVAVPLAVVEVVTLCVSPLSAAESMVALVNAALLVVTMNFTCFSPE
jgi:hypothetical protein